MRLFCGVLRFCVSDSWLARFAARNVVYIEKRARSAGGLTPPHELITSQAQPTHSSKYQTHQVKTKQSKHAHAWMDHHHIERQRSRRRCASYVERFDRSYPARVTHSDQRPLGPILLLEVLRRQHRHQQKRYCCHFPSKGFRRRGRQCRRRGARECY